MAQQHTAVKNQESKIDIIEHVNNDHVKELQEIVFANSNFKEITSVKIKDIFEEGCLLTIEIKKEVFEELFIPFTIKGELEEKVLFLAYKSMVNNGKPLIISKKQYFEVIDNSFVTKNMLRLTVKSDTKIPTEPALAYLFSLKKLEKIHQTANKPQKVNALTKLFDKIFLFLMKLLSSKQRSSLLDTMNKNIRYYTVRKTWNKNNNYFARIDIYIHGKTNGGEWSKHLKPGDIITSTNEYKEKFEHLNQGKALLIADETALPAVAAILEQWKNPVTPEVIIVTNHKEEQTYLNEVENKSYNTHYILNSKNLYENIIQTVEKMGTIETIWGALEKETATNLRKHFRNTLKIDSKNNRVTGYWKLKK